MHVQGEAEEDNQYPGRYAMVIDLLRMCGDVEKQKGVEMCVQKE